MKTFKSTFTRLALLVFGGFLLPFLLSLPAQAQQTEPFLITPYFETKSINSYFDHEYPTQGRNGSIVIHTGERRTPASPNIAPLCILGVSCYDGHEGVDFATGYGAVLAAAAGQVTQAGWHVFNCRQGDFCALGLRIEITHSNGYITKYGHLSTIAVVVGQQVHSGQIIGASGSTGNSTGSHLHFEVLNTAQQRVDPFGWTGNYTDPWRAHNGTISSCLWKDGEWANLCGGVSRPIPAPHSGGEILVEDSPINAGGFSKGGGGIPNNSCAGHC